MSQDICFMAATELIERYRDRSISPVEVTEAVLAQIQTHDPGINAFVISTGDLARQQARAAETAYANGSAGPLAGVPISIKDLAPVKDVPFARGSLIYADTIATEDAPFVTRVKEAGAVIIGKTTTPEFGWKGETTSPVTGCTHNPWK